MDLVQPISEYKAYVASEVTVLVAETQKFAAAVKARDLKTAQALYAPTRVHYERIEPIAELWDFRARSPSSPSVSPKPKTISMSTTGSGWSGRGQFSPIASI